MKPSKFNILIGFSLFCSFFRNFANFSLKNAEICKTPLDRGCVQRKTMLKKRYLRITFDTNFNKKVKKISKKKAIGDDSYPRTQLCVFFHFLPKKRLFIAISRERKSPKVSLFSQNQTISCKFCKLSLLNNVLILLYFRLEIYRGFRYQIFDFLDIGEFLTNFGNSGF